MGHLGMVLSLSHPAIAPATSSLNWFEQLPQNLLLGLEQGSLYALVALGYTLVYGVLQLINFAHSEVFMTGAYGSFVVINLILVHVGAVTGVGAVLTVIVGMIAGALAAAAIAWLLEKTAYKTLRKRNAPKLAFLISAIGASLFLQNLAGKLFHRDTGRTLPTDLGTSHRLISSKYFTLTTLQVMIIVIALAMMVFLDVLVNRTKLGRSIRAVAEDAPTAALMGIDIDKTISRTFVIGGALAGVAGFMYAIGFSVSYTMGFVPSVKAFAAAVLGGIGNIRGAMFGGLLLGEVETLVGALHFVGAQWEDVVSFAVLVLVLVFRPTGLLGERLGRAA